MNNIDKCNLIATIGEEINYQNELLPLFESGKQIIVYDGFEPSGRMHIAQGLLRTINTNKFTKCGCKFKFWVADWFAQMNLKYGGDLNKIKKAGELMIEIWKACGMDLENVEFIWASDEINKRSNEYWKLILDISTRFNVNRIKKCSKIMGRDKEDDLMCSQLYYPVMQCADIFFLKADICSLGLDQRKVNMLAREYCDKVKIKHKPIIVSHHMILGLDGTKMSKGNPNNAIFMDDSEMEVNSKIKKAFCQPGNIVVNPILEYFKYIIFELQPHVEVKRKEENGGNITFGNYKDMEKDFEQLLIHPDDLKQCLKSLLNQYLLPVREYFKNNEHANKLMKQVKSF